MLLCLEMEKTGTTQVFLCVTEYLTLFISPNTSKAYQFC